MNCFNLKNIFILFFSIQYQLKELKDICEKRLINQIDEENFFDLVCFANKHKADQLKRKTLEYIERYEWYNFQHIILLQKYFTFLLNRNKTTLSETSQVQWSKYIESPFIDEQFSHIATYWQTILSEIHTFFFHYKKHLALSLTHIIKKTLTIKNKQKWYQFDTFFHHMLRAYNFDNESILQNIFNDFVISGSLIIQRVHY